MTIDVDMLISGVVMLVIGIILYAVIKYIPPGATVFAKIGSIILSIIGIVLIVLSFILPIVGYP